MILKNSVQKNLVLYLSAEKKSVKFSSGQRGREKEIERKKRQEERDRERETETDRQTDRDTHRKSYDNSRLYEQVTYDFLPTEQTYHADLSSSYIFREIETQ